MKREHFSSSGLGVEPVRKARLGACRLVGEDERVTPGGKVLRQAADVLSGLRFDGDQRVTLGLGLDRAGRFTVDIAQVVDASMGWFQHELPDSHSSACRQVGSCSVLDSPPGGGEQAVDQDSRSLFRRQSRKQIVVVQDLQPPRKDSFRFTLRYRTACSRFRLCL